MIKRIMKDPLVRGSIVLMVAFGVFNFLNFMFHLIMARSLDTADYGVLATLFSIMYIMGFFTESIQTVITKYSAAQSSDGKIASLLKKSIRKARSMSIIIFACYLVASFFLSLVLGISWSLIALNGSMIFCAFYLPVTRGVLQGKKRFGTLGLNVIIESVVKIIIATLLVWAGWRVYGAITGTLIGAICAYLVSKISLRKISQTKEESADISEIYAYSRPTFVLIMGFMIFYSLDVILAKFLFDSTTAGVYAIASVLAKTIFLGTQPISRAMFPLAAENKSGIKQKNKIIFKAFALILPIIIIALALFYFAPDFIIRIFSGRAISDAAGILFYLGLGVSLISLSNLLILYHLSSSSVKQRYLIFIPAIIEVVVLSVFSSNLAQFAIAFVISCAALFVTALVMTFVRRSDNE